MANARKLGRPKILLLDIETSPILGHVWGLWENNLGVNQIHRDWFVLSWAAKWRGQKKIFYLDQRKEKNLEDDSRILKAIWKLLDEADIVITQNGKSFDIKKLFARFVIHKMKPPSSFKQIDTKLIAKKVFGFTSNGLEYMTNKLCKKKKLQHKKFPGMELWIECLKRNPRAWLEMERYNKQDVLSLEELCDHIYPWDNSVNFALYSDEPTEHCNCGGKIRKNGFCYSSQGKYQRYYCTKCGAEVRGKNNLFSKEKKASLKLSTSK